ncbi:PadR family transcriptional regulator [Lentibacillus salinarum]|uniref:PadR family transcriptional regulator n=1 Tax=Lentibacillus salinarum TaxID=446820 RepID=A0ABW3ZY97_9BACI
MKGYNHTTYAILGLLTIGCHSGYAIKQMIDQSLNHFWKISYGQIYPTLKQLVQDDLATVEETSQEGKPHKKEYFITSKGEAELREWLQSPIDAIPVEKNNVLLKLFFSRHQPHDHTIAHLEAYKQKLQAHYHTYETIEQMIVSQLHEEKDAPYWLFTLDYGKRVTAAAVDWCSDTIQKLNDWEEI